MSSVDHELRIVRLERELKAVTAMVQLLKDKLSVLINTKTIAPPRGDKVSEPQADGVP